MIFNQDLGKGAVILSLTTSLRDSPIKITDPKNNKTSLTTCKNISGQATLEENSEMARTKADARKNKPVPTAPSSPVLGLLKWSNERPGTITK